MNYFANTKQKSNRLRVFFLSCVFIFAAVFSYMGLPAAAAVANTAPTAKQPTTKAVNLFDPAFKGLSVEKKLHTLRKILPNGKYWNSTGTDIAGLPQNFASSITSNTPCAHAEEGVDHCNVYNGVTAELFDYGDNMQCLGFASLVSDFLFGKDAPLVLLEDFADLQVGDHIRYIDYEHSMIVTAIGVDTVTVVECNQDYENCLIAWDITLSKEELNSYYDVLFISRQARN